MNPFTRTARTGSIIMSPAIAGFASRSVFLALGCLAVVAGCAIDPASEDAAQSSEALANNGGGPGTRKCEDKYGDCYIGCAVKYPEPNDGANNLNALMRQGCEDSCDAAYDLCKSFARRRPPVQTNPPNGSVLPAQRAP
jgi:hypothetical protein